MKKVKYLFVPIIIITVSLIAAICQENLILLLYTTILALFPSELKSLFNNFFKDKQLRLSYSYLFNIQIGNCYLLVKDSQGRNQYQPVGGVYKYDANLVDINELFHGTSDGLFADSNSSSNELRIVINKRKLTDFNTWFKSYQSRETIENLGREFKEELIDSNILKADIFEEIKYRYVGSFTEKGVNSSLRLPQIRHFDVVSFKPTNAQRTYLENLMRQTSFKYVFASKQDIENGFIQFAGHRYNIAEHAKLILVGNSSILKKESHVKDILNKDNSNNNSYVKIKL